MENISSKYIINNIFDYVINPKFKYQFLIHSKKFQNFLDIDIVDYEELFLEKFGLTLETYLYNEEDNGNYDKDYLKKKYEEDIKANNLDYNLFTKIIVDNIAKMDKESDKHLTENEYYSCDYLIDAFSPLLFHIAKIRIFKVFTIEIPCGKIEKYKLKNDYISVFDKLNQEKIDYSSISFKYENYKDIDYLKELHIKLNQIKSLAIIQKKKEKGKKEEEEEEEEDELEDLLKSWGEDDRRCFLKKFFDYSSELKNLLYLNLEKMFLKNIYLKSELLENINNFKSLKELTLYKICCVDKFNFQLPNLESLSLEKCENILLDNEYCLNLKTLELNSCLLFKPKNLLKLPNLEEYNINRCDYDIDEIVDFSSLKKLKSLTCNIDKFLKLRDNILEEIIITNKEKPSFIEEKQMLEKIISSNTLKEVRFHINQLDDYEISNIPGENISIETLIIHWSNDNKDCILYNLQKKFPNSKEILLLEPDIYNSEKKEINIEFKEDKKCKVDTIEISAYFIYKNIKLFCSPFNKLKSIEIKIKDQIKNIKDILPIFNDNCKIYFFDLEKFIFFISKTKISMDILKNLYNNITYIQRVRYFTLNCISEDLTEEFYIQLIKKLLALKIYKLKLIIKKNVDDEGEEYSKEELKNIYPNLDQYEELFIQKYK